MATPDVIVLTTLTDSYISRSLLSQDQGNFDKTAAFGKVLKYSRPKPCRRTVSLSQWSNFETFDPMNQSGVDFYLKLVTE